MNAGFGTDYIKRVKEAQHIIDRRNRRVLVGKSIGIFGLVCAMAFVGFDTGIKYQTKRNPYKVTCFNSFCMIYWTDGKIDHYSYKRKEKLMIKRHIKLVEVKPSGVWRVIEWEQAGKPMREIAQFVNRKDAVIFLDELKRQGAMEMEEKYGP